VQSIRVCKSWTLSCTPGLDYGLKFGKKFGQMHNSVLTIFYRESLLVTTLMTVNNNFLLDFIKAHGLRFIDYGISFTSQSLICSTRLQYKTTVQDYSTCPYSLQYLTLVCTHTESTKTIGLIPGGSRCFSFSDV